MRIDFRGHGESEQSLEEFSLKSQIEDLVTAIEWLKNKEDNLRIITLGISFGAPPIMDCVRAIFINNKEMCFDCSCCGL